MSLLDSESFSQNKIIFLGAVAVLVVVLLIGASMLSSGGDGTKKAPAAKELSVWVVGDETAGFSDIIAGFKKRYPEYNSTDIKFTNFGSYSDYEKTLLSVIADGNSPDIFVVNNNGGELLESKILGLPASVINPDEFAKNFNKAFDDLVISTKEKDADGKEVTISGLKGVPLGYQTLGIFYNWKLVHSVPRLWDEIGGSSEDGKESDAPYVDLMLGLEGKYIPGVSDILVLLFLQHGVDSVDKLSSPEATRAIAMYYSGSGRTNPNTIATIVSKLHDLNLTTLDSFVRGDIAMVIGFPSLLREIEYSVKRAGSESVLSDKFLRTSEIPQLSSDPKDLVNLVDYNYFAVSRTSTRTEVAYAFLNYLSSREAGEKYLEKFPSYLPAQRVLEERRSNESISQKYERVKYRSFMNPDTELRSFDKGLKSEYETYFAQAIGNITVSPKDILSGAIEYIGCHKKHMIDKTSFDEVCKIKY